MPDNNPESDQAFGATIQNSGNVVLTCLFLDPALKSITIEERKEHKFSWQPPSRVFRRNALNLPTGVKEKLKKSIPDYFKVVLPLESLMEGAWGVGSTSYKPDEGGVVRRFPLIHRYMDNFYPSLPLIAAANFLDVPISKIRLVPNRYIQLPLSNGDPVRIPIDKEGCLLVNYRSGDLNVFPNLNFAKCWESYNEWLSTGDWSDLKNIKDKSVVLGSIAEGTEDTANIPLMESYPETFIVATVVDQIIKRDFLVKTPWNVDFVIILFNCLITGFFSARFRPSARLLLTFFQCVVYLYVNFLLFKNLNYHAPVFSPLLAIVFSFISILLLKYILERNARLYAENLFGKYLDPKIVKEFIKNPDVIKLGGETRKLALVFTDLAGFTSLSEKMESEEVVSMLNEYFREMMPAISETKGIVDKYMGDAIMVIFGLPFERPDDAKNAVKCALEMLKRLEKRKKAAHPGVFEKLNMRIGINYGQMTVGNIGTESKQQFTVIGDQVNLAARLESNAPVNGILISESVFKEVKDVVEVKPMGEIKVKGKEEMVSTYQVLGMKN